MSVHDTFAAAAALAVLCAAVTACSATVGGTGHAVTPSQQVTGFPTAPSTQPSTDPSSSPGPTDPSSAPAGSFTCPTITYPKAHLRFDCITDGLALNAKNVIWPVSLLKPVEPATGWVLEEGAGNWGDPGTQAAADIALEVRKNMVDAGGYGTTPTVRTDRNADATVGGVPAHILQTTVTINPAWAKTRGTKVTSERLWIVVLKVSASDDALWYTSIPNLASQLWAKVPTIMATIRVS